MLFVFGGFLILTAVRLLRHDDEEIHPENNPVLALVPQGGAVHQRVPRPVAVHAGSDGKRLATPLFAVLVVVETSDVIFAVDSIPAILAVSREQFIVFSSNAFAILGLRALYFLLADLRDKFDYLQPGLAVILAFVGVEDDPGRVVPHPHVPLARGDRRHPRGGHRRVRSSCERPDGHGPDEVIDRHHGEGLELLDSEELSGRSGRAEAAAVLAWGWCGGRGGRCGASSRRCRSRPRAATASTPSSVSSSSRRAVSTRTRST